VPASIVGLIVTISSVIQGIVGRRTLKSMHRETQETLRTLGAGQTRLGEILAQMETNADARARDRKDRLGGEAEDRPLIDTLTSPRYTRADAGPCVDVAGRPCA
jgi:hypothetical protein